MAEITAQLIKTLRDKTNAGMMDCKAALTEAGGDLEEAETVLRKKGIMKAEGKGSREAKEGLIDAYIDSESRVGSIVEINCETDFVAKNENFVGFVNSISRHVAKVAGDTGDVELLEAQDFTAQPGNSLGDVVKVKIAELGENLVLRRFVRYALADGSHGVVAKYIHLAGKVGVLVEVGSEKAETVFKSEFLDVVKDVTLQIAAAQPLVVTRDEVDPALVAKEKDVYAEQVKGKPENIVEKIVGGKLDKYYSTICLLEQGYIKDQDKTISDLLKATGNAIGDTISIRRFTRYAIGEQI